MVCVSADWHWVRLVGGLAVGLLLALSGPAVGQPASGANEGLIDAAVHLVKIGRFDEAAPMLTQVLATNPTPAEALRLRNRAGYDFWAPLLSHPTLGGPVRNLLRLAYEAIRTNRADPVYIGQMIALLETAEHGQAVSQLRSCGPYAIPALIQVLRSGQPAGKRHAVEAVLTRMPAEAAPAMVEGLRCSDLNVRAALADALGQMHSRLALHELKRLAEDVRLSEATHLSVSAAVRAILGRKAWSAKPAVEYALELVMALHRADDWAVPPGTSETVPVWTWDEAQKRLTAVEAPRTQYGHLVAERTAERLVADWPKYEPAYPAWYLAKLGKLWEAQTRPAAALEAEAVAKEVRALGSVLGEARLMAGCQAAIERGDYRAAQGFLSGLRLTASARGVRVDPTVAKALAAPDRGVRYEAALVLVAADPRQAFPGSELVVPVLAEALNQAASQEVVVAVPDLQVVNQFRSALRQAGFVVRDMRTSREALDLVMVAPALEVVMLDTALKDPDADVFLRQVRSVRRTRDLPVLLVAGSAAEEARLKTGLALRYRHVGVLREASAPEAVSRLVASAIAAARGRRLSPAEAGRFARDAAEALLTVETSHPVFRLALAAPQARAALADGPEELRVAACVLLGKVGDAPSQQALAQTIVQEGVSSAVVHGALRGLVDAMRRHGNALDRKQVSGLRVMLDSEDAVVVDLTARLIGLTGVAAEDLAGAFSRASRPRQ